MHFLIQSLILLTLTSSPLRAAEYIQEDNIYSFTFPDTWKTKMLGHMVVMAPKDDDQAAVCFSKAEPSPSIKGKLLETALQEVADNKILSLAITSAQSEAKIISDEGMSIKNSKARKLVYEGSNKDGDSIRSSMFFTYNINSGHTVDITCTTPSDKWDIYKDDIASIQTSLNILENYKLSEKSGPDFIRDFFDGKDEVVTEYTQSVRSKITNLQLPDGSNIPSETPEELQIPVIPFLDAKRVVNRGILTAMAEYCGHEWDTKSFIPFMQQERSKNTWSDKQLAFIGGLHGVVQGNIARGLKAKGPCPEAMERQTKNFLISIE